MSTTIFSGITKGDGHGAPVTDLVSAERYGEGGTLALSAWCDRGYNEPKNAARLYVETSADDGANWETLVDFGSMRDDVIATTEAHWDGVSDIRVRYEFDPGDETSYWWPVVRLG